MSVMWRSLALAGIALLAVAAPAAGLQPGKAPLAIVLHLDIVNQTASLNGSSSEQRISMAGQVRIDYVVFAVRVLLSSSADTSWTTEVSPREMTFNSSGVQYFMADVFIPAGTFNQTATLTVRGNASVSGLPADTSSDSATIVVNGPGEGDVPEIPVVPPPKGPPSAAALPNLPAVTAAVSVAMVGATAAVFWIWKARRLRRTEAAKKERRRETG